ncbi:MAG: hypothetical protein CFH39_01886 [Alphaproteobacteria bacterium MarineAlpha10_Bin2]|nr:MAG: hypothetical protein CFH39_01886 [Alphaproteobacteria bacterium MarineAlpha10_Bin2]
MKSLAGTETDPIASTAGYATTADLSQYATDADVSANTDAIAAALQAASDEIETQSDMWADADYRKQLIRSLGAEVVATAFARAAS